MNQEWITTMRVNLLPNGPNQPFYNVLVQDGTCRYAAQGNVFQSEQGYGSTEQSEQPHTDGVGGRRGGAALKMLSNRSG